MANEMIMVAGRIVWVNGDLFAGAPDTVFGTNNPKLNQRTGKQDTVFRFGLAVPKAELSDPTRGAIWAAIHNQVRALYPSGQPPQNFAWKYKDGDGQGTDERGGVVDYSKKEGYPGCLVFTLSTTNYPPRFFKWENGNVQVADGIKCGDYVNVQVEVAGQVSAKPGLYLNPKAVQLMAPGKEIINAPSADQLFGTAAPPAPSNYVPPTQPTMPMMPQPGNGYAPGVAQPPGMPQFAPPNGNPAMGNGFAPPAYPSNPAMPPPGPVPHHGVLPQPFQPPPGGQVMGNWPAAPQPQGYPAPGAAVTHSGVPTPPSFVTNAANPGFPPYPPGVR